MGQSKLTKDEIKRRVEESCSFSQVAREAGVSRERIRQIWRANFASSAPDGMKNGNQLRQIKTNRDRKQRAERAMDDSHRLFRLRLLVEDVGLTLEPIVKRWTPAEPRRLSVKINEHLCRVYSLASANPTSTKSDRLYYRTCLTTEVLNSAKFILFLVDDPRQSKLAFIVPTEKLLKDRGGARYWHVAIPTEPQPVYNNQARFEWWDYANKWELLEPTKEAA